MCDRYAISFYWYVSAVQVCPEGHRAAEVQFSPVLSPLSLNHKPGPEEPVRQVQEQVWTSSQKSLPWENLHLNLAGLVQQFKV